MTRGQFRFQPELKPTSWEHQLIVLALISSSARDSLGISVDPFKWSPGPFWVSGLIGESTLQAQLTWQSAGLKRRCLAEELPPFPCQMASRDSESQTCFKQRGKVTFRDEVLGPTLLRRNTGYVYIGVLGFWSSCWFVAGVSGLVLAQIKKKSFPSFQCWEMENRASPHRKRNATGLRTGK